MLQFVPVGGCIVCQSTLTMGSRMTRRPPRTRHSWRAKPAHHLGMPAPRHRNRRPSGRRSARRRRPRPGSARLEPRSPCRMCAGCVPGASRRPERRASVAERRFRANRGRRPDPAARRTHARSGDRLEHALARRVRHRGRPGRDAQLGPDVGHVAVHRVRAEEEPRGDLRVAQARGDQPQDVDLARAQLLGRAAGRAAARAAARAELRQRLARRAPPPPRDRAARGPRARSPGAAAPRRPRTGPSRRRRGPPRPRWPGGRHRGRRPRPAPGRAPGARARPCTPSRGAQPRAPRHLRRRPRPRRRRPRRGRARAARAPGRARGRSPPRAAAAPDPPPRRPRRRRRRRARARPWRRSPPAAAGPTRTTRAPRRGGPAARADARAARRSAPRARAASPAVVHRAPQLLLGRRPVAPRRQHLAVGRAADAEEVPGAPGGRPGVHRPAPLRRAAEVAHAGARRHRVAQRPSGRRRLGEVLAHRQRGALVEAAHALVDAARRQQRAAEDRERHDLDAGIRDRARQDQRLAREPSAAGGSEPASSAMSASSRPM